MTDASAAPEEHSGWDTGGVRFGSDEAGLLCAYLFRPGEVAGTVEAADACEIVVSAAEADRDAFLWLHFNLANQASHRWLHHRLLLPDAFHSALASAASTRVELAGESIVAVINDVTLFGLDASEVSTMVLCVDSRMLVSARHTPLRSVGRLRESVQQGERFRSPVELLAHLLRDQADVLVQVVRDATGQVDRIEDQLMSEAVASTRTHLGTVRRTLVRLRRLLAPEPSALFRLLNRPPGWVGAEDVQELRQSAEELATAVGDCLALVERVRLLQEEVVAIVNEQTNRTLFILTVVTVFALPMTVIPGLLGMNVGGVPLRDSAGGFWSVVMFLVAATSAGAFFALRQRNRT